MKFRRREQGRLCYELRGSEREVLAWILKLYPVMPDGHCQITRDAALDPDHEHQQLLEEALGTQRRENQERITTFLNAERRFELLDTTFLLRLTETEADWLLEVLNEIRVGSWVRLGKPDPGAETNLPMTQETMHHLWAMELAGCLESQFLDGLTARP